MKLTIVILIVGGHISCSLQQGRFFRVGWFPNNFPQARLPYYYFTDHQYSHITDMSPILLPTNDVQGRPAVLSPFFKTSKNDNPQSRFLGFMLYNQLRKSLLFPSVSTVTFTSTSTSVITIISSVTTVSIQFCISSTNLAAGVSSACPVRKRSIELDAIEPSKVLSMEISQTALSYNEQDSKQYVFSSSLSDLQESDEVAPRQFVEGLFPTYSKVFPSVPISTQVVTVTSTTTRFSLIASPVKKPIVIATPITVPGTVAGFSSTRGGVLCLPPGFVVC